jgi:hypothetical protein
LHYYGSFGTHIPGQPNDLRAFADAWNYREPTGQVVKVGALLIGTLQNYAPDSYPPQELVLEALNECNQLQMRRTKRGNLRLTTTIRGIFSCRRLLPALADPDAEQELRIIIEAVPKKDWPAITLLARAFWRTASRLPISNELCVEGDPPVAELQQT